MTTDANDQQLDMQNNHSAKRVWSTPRVIESDLADTQISRPQYPNPTDIIYSGFRFGPGS